MNKKRIHIIFRRFLKMFIFKFEDGMTLAGSIAMDQIPISGYVKTFKELSRGKKYDSIPLTGRYWYSYLIIRILYVVEAIMKYILPPTFTYYGDYTTAGVSFTLSWVILGIHYIGYTYFHYIAKKKYLRHI